MTKAQREIRDRNPMPYREKLLVKKALRNCEMEVLIKRIERMEATIDALVLRIEEARLFTAPPSTTLPPARRTAQVS